MPTFSSAHISFGRQKLSHVRFLPFFGSFLAQGKKERKEEEKVQILLPLRTISILASQYSFIILFKHFLGINLR